LSRHHPVEQTSCRQEDIIKLGKHLPIEKTLYRWKKSYFWADIIQLGENHHTARQTPYNSEDITIKQTSYKQSDIILKS
jgi:hypothetical protein